MNAVAGAVSLRQSAQQHAVPPPAPPAAPSVRGRPAADRLVGREGELGAMEAFLRQGLAGGATRTVYGTAGAGKSELLEAGVEAAADAGLRVLRCAGARGAAAAPRSGLLQLMWPLLDGPPPVRGAGPLRDLEELLLDGASGADGTPLPFLVLGALESAAADRPLLLTVDDFDALDAASAEVLAFVARRTAGRRLAVLIAARHGSGSGRRALLSGLPELPLGPLSPAQSAELVALRRPGCDPLAERELLATAAGNPLALLELPARTGESVPDLPPSSDRLAAALAPGAALLPAATRDLLLVAALHPDGELPLLMSAAARIGGTAPGFEAVERAEREGLVVCEGTGLRFTHPAAAGAVVHGVGPARCRTAHAALAEVMERDPVRRAWHSAQAAEGTDAGLAARLEAVHGDALERGEPVTAIRMLRRAADLYTAPEDQGRCALLAARLAHDLGSRRMARMLAHRALRHPLGPLGSLCARVLAGQQDATGDERRSWADPANWPVPEGPGEEEHALELARLTAPGITADAERSEALLAFLDRMPRRAGDPRLVHAMATVGGTRRAGVVVARLSAASDTHLVPVRDLERLGEAALLAGAALRALDLYRQAEHRCRSLGLDDRLPHVWLRQGLAHLLMGDWGQAGRSFARCGESAPHRGRDRLASAASMLGRLVRGLRAGTVPVVDAADLAAARHSVRFVDDVVAVATAWARVEGGDFTGGHAGLLALLTDPGRAAVARYALVPFAEAAEAVGAGRGARALLNRLAAETKETEETEADRSAPQAAAVAVDLSSPVAAELAVARAVLSDGQEADDRYGRAFAMDLSRRPFLAASLRLAHGRLLRRRREITDSRVTLRQAAAAFTVADARARVARITAELRAGGARTETAASGGAGPASVRDLLSAQELRIARLAAHGLSNRAIGEELGLAPRTIGAYLYRIFPRLGVTARTQLVAVLREVRDD
ncbi:AAA family ATPase [Streptomyces violaceorubidus]|uniref:AAA family ATPase n=1 Tax=Streptomyces violaceorubidus TaxID=284042 RepID=UPI000996A13C|nr:LuxR family transcriptional regulator [Streptomyces violaceorubidus]